jgi:PAS domain S-box-containing protein
MTEPSPDTTDLSRRVLLSILEDEIRACENLKKSEQRFRKFVETSPDGISVVGLDGLISFISPKILEIYGHSHESEIIGRSPIEWIAAEDRERARDNMSSILNGTPSRSNRYRLLKKDGTVFWGEINSSALTDEQGNPAGLIAIVRDVTEKVLIEEEKQQNEARWRLSIDNMLEAYALHEAILDEYGRMVDYRFLEFNPAAQKIANITRKDIIGRTALELFPHVVERGLMKRYSDVMATGEPAYIEDFYYAGDNLDKAFDISCFRIDDRHFVCVFRDVTGRKWAEEKIRISEERFSRAFFSSPAGMSITRIADGTFIEVNDAFLRIFEFSREETIGKRSTVLQMLTPGQREELIRKQLETGGLNNEELNTRSKSGRVIHLLFSSRPIEVDGEPCHITTMIDITDRKKAEETARQQLEELQRWYEATLGREDRVRQLKHEVNQLLKRLGEPSRYASPEADQATPAAGSDAPV